MELDTIIEETELSSKIVNILKRSAKINTVSELMLFSRENLRNVHGIGPQLYEELILFIEESGIVLDEELSPEELLKRNRQRATHIQLSDGVSNIFPEEIGACLEEYGVECFGDLLNLSQSELIKILNVADRSSWKLSYWYMDRVSVDIFLNVVHGYGLSFDFELMEDEKLQGGIDRTLGEKKAIKLEKKLGEDINTLYECLLGLDTDEFEGYLEDCINRDSGEKKLIHSRM